MTSFDQAMLERAMRLAMSQRGRVEPNPMVGCVLVWDGTIIGEGAHSRYGGSHAEPTALAECSAQGNLATGATAYVTLEPCCHTNKKTPPCAPLLIEAGIARVLVGCLDPNPQVNGRGIGMLRDAGVVVEVAPEPLAASYRQLIAPFILRTRHQRPYVTLKWAQTADGCVAGPGGARLHISNGVSTRAVHMLRTRSDAIAVGVNTLIHDDPLLTVRGVEQLRMPHRYVLDTHGRTPADARVLHDESAPTTVVVADEAAAQRLRTSGHDVLLVIEAKGRIDLLGWLESVDATHLLVEPGPTLARGFFEANLCDRLWVIESPDRGPKGAGQAAYLPDHFARSGSIDLSGDVLSEYLNTRGNAYFRSEASADLHAIGTLKDV